MLWVVAACWVTITGLSESDDMLSPLPLFHSYALNLSVLGIVAVGASAYVMERYSTSECLSLLREQKFTLFPGVPTMFHYLLEGKPRPGARLPEPDALHLGRRHHAGDAQSRVRGALRHPAARRLRHHRDRDHGDDELADRHARDGLVRSAVPGLAVRIVDPATGLDAAAEAQGELIVRGPNLMRRYHDKPAETAAALQDGWYHTGDLAKFGRLTA